MISKRELLNRIKKLERETTFLVPVVDEDGEQIKTGYYASSLWKIIDGEVQYIQCKSINMQQVCKAIQDMYNIEITYQEIKGSEGVVIYEKESD